MPTNDLVLLSTIEERIRKKFYIYIKRGKIEGIKTSKGMAIHEKDINYFNTIHRNDDKVASGFQISLNETSRINALYYKVADMNEQNRKLINNSTVYRKIPRYVAEDGYVYINIKDFIKPSLKVVAKRIECPVKEVENCIFALLKKLYTKRKTKETKEFNKELKKIQNKEKRTNTQV